MNDDLPEIGIVRSQGGAGIIEAVLDAICVIVLILMTSITTVDVVGRYLFHSPLLGAYEASELLLGVLIFSAIPRVTWHRQHLTVSLIDAWLGPRAKTIQQFVLHVISTVLLAVLTLYLYKHAGQLAEYGDMSNALQVPIAPFAYLIATMTAIATIASCIRIFLPYRR